jgi:predicted ATP-grasp superfamily ATP-dependent carboligase
VSNHQIQNDQREQQRLLVFEYSMAGEDQQGMVGISIEGLVMLVATIEDALAGGFSPVVPLSDNLEGTQISADPRIEWKAVRDDDSLEDRLRELAEGTGIAFLIAPEINNHLARLTASVEATGCTVLSQPSRVIKKASDKLGALAALGVTGISVPETTTMEQFLEDESIPLPAVVKPRYGAGCIGVFRVDTEVDVRAAIDAAAALGILRDELIVQEFVPGKAMSLSAFGSGRRALVASINEQAIELGRPGEGSSYSGGSVGANYDGLDEVCRTLADAVVECFGLVGYFGVDFILNDDGDASIIEVNARLTTAFAGMHRIATGSYMAALADAASGFERSLPRLDGCCAFRTGHSASVPGIDRIPGIKIKTAPLFQSIRLVDAAGNEHAFFSAKGASRSAAAAAVDRIRFTGQ